ncbi:iron ABC transporter substrate-binding protein [soil metagenome]
MLLVLLLVVGACAADDAADTTAEETATEPADTEQTETEADTEATEATEEETEADATEEETEGEATEGEGSITIYSGRSEELVGPLLERFTEATGIEVEVRYGDTAELAATILDEGQNSPADVFFGQDAGALGALRAEGLLTELPSDITDEVDARFRATDGTWVGASGRARVLVYSTDLVTEEELPDSVFELTEEQWNGRVGWAPTNGSFQAFVTAMRISEGEDVTRDWLEGMIANDVQVYSNNGSQVEAAAAGEIAIGLVNNYYLARMAAENPDIAAANHFLPGSDIGSLINIAGAGILATSDQTDLAEEFVAYLLGEEAQTYFAEETYEYPLAAGVEADAFLPSLDEIGSPEIDLSDLADLQGTLDLLVEVGAI